MRRRVVPMVTLLAFLAIWAGVPQGSDAFWHKKGDEKGQTEGRVSGGVASRHPQEPASEGAREPATLMQVVLNIEGMT